MAFEFFKKKIDSSSARDSRPERPSESRQPASPQDAPREIPVQMAAGAMYDPDAVRPMAEELEFVGFQSLKTADEVDEVLSSKEGSALVVVNSVCGCAAGAARPGVVFALQHKTIPDRLITVFAGVDRASTQRAREYMSIPPSSPCIVLFKDGEMVFALQRQHIEMMDAERLSEALRKAFDAHCSAEGPSIPPEEFARLELVQRCGSSIPIVGG